MSRYRGRMMELTAKVRIEDGCYWADVPDLPGCFASGDTLDELFEALREGIELYLSDGSHGRTSSRRPFHIMSAVLADTPADKS